jgi:hypothetical protein
MNRRLSGRRRRKQAITPAIATMLLLVMIISVTMLVMIWGLPKIQNLQSDASYKMAKSYFEALDDSVYTLCKGNVGDSISSPIKFPDGTYSISNNVDFWIITYQLSREYTVIFQDLGDGDNKVDLFEAEGKNIDGARVNVSWPLLDKEETASNQPIYPKGTKYYFTARYRIDSATRFTLNYKGKDISECWVISLDQISIEMDTFGGGFEIHETNNALLSNYPHKEHVETGPDFHLNHKSRTFVANFAKFDINGVSTADQGSYHVNLNLKTIGIGVNDQAMNLRMEFTGDYKDAWYSFFIKQYSGYVIEENTMKFIYDSGVTDFNGLILETPSMDDPLSMNLVSFKIRVNLIQVQTEAMA